jgi:hypothetical protein
LIKNILLKVYCIEMKKMIWGAEKVYFINSGSSADSEGFGFLVKSRR